jgi:hypothetical protein
MSIVSKICFGTQFAVFANVVFLPGQQWALPFRSASVVQAFFEELGLEEEV